jgi:hypothetical protein
MATIGLKKGTIIPYILEADRGEEDPPVFHLRYVPNGAVEAGARKIAGGLKNTHDPKMLVAVQQAAQKQQFIDNLARIENYKEAEMDGQGNLVVKDRAITPEEFYAEGDTAKIRELILAMESADKLTEGQRKNSSPASATASSGGTGTEAGASIAGNVRP